MVSNSTFNTVGKAIVMYNEGAPVLDMTVNICTFLSSQTTDKAAIQMHTEWGISGKLTINNSTATGFAAINNGLYNELNNNTKTPTHKFNITVDGKVASTLALKAALAAGATSICIEGEIDLKDVTLSGYNGTIVGADGTAVLNTRNFTPSRDEAYQLRSQNLTFKNISFKLPTNINLLQSGFVGTGAIVFDNCSFEGQATLNGSATWTFNDCDFVSTVSGNYASVVYGVNKATFNRCSFSGVDRAAKVYGTGGDLDVEYNTCTFTSSTLNKYGVEIDASYATTVVKLNTCSQTAMAGLYALEGSKGTVYVDGNQQ